MTDRLSRRHQIVVDVLTPLHVGTGTLPLRRDFDFVAGGSEIQVVDPAKALASGKVGRAGELAADTLPGDTAAYVIVYGGGPAPDAILPMPHAGSAYLPGSAVKGAVRTVLASSLLEKNRASGSVVKMADLAPSARFAAQPVERTIFGDRPGSSALRALRISDLGTDSTIHLGMARAYGEDEGKLTATAERVFLEVVPPGARFTGDATMDAYLIGQTDNRYEATPGRAALNDLVSIAQDEARRRLTAERDYAQSRGGSAVVAAYDALLAIANSPTDNTFLVQIGWGGGWTSKSLGPALEKSGDFAAIKAQFLTPEQRGRRGPRQGGSAGQRQGGPGAGQPRRGAVVNFPATRRYVEIDGQPALPFGWVLVSLVDAGADLPAAVAAPSGWKDSPVPAAVVPATDQVISAEDALSPFARMQALLAQTGDAPKVEEAAPPPPIAPVNDKNLKPGVVLDAEVLDVAAGSLTVNAGRKDPTVIDAAVLGGGDLTTRFTIGQRIRVRVLTAPPFFRVRLG